MTDISASDPRPHAIFGVRDFRLFICGRFLSTASMQMQSVAVGWQVYDLTQDPIALGYVGLFMFLSVAAFTLPGGDVADRFDRRLVLSLAYIGQAACAVLLVWVSWAGVTAMWPFYTIVAMFGVGRAFANPASQSFVPFLVPREQVSRAVAWSSSANQVAFIVGPALGGAVYAFGPAAVYAICFAAFVGGAITNSAIRIQVKIPPAEDKSAFGRLVAGIHFVRRRPIVLGVISLDLFAVLLGGALSLLPVYARDILHVGPEGLGLLRSASAAGAMVTAVAVANLSLNRKTGLLMFGAVAFYAVCTIAFGVSANFGVSLAALALLGAADQISVITRNTVVQLATPADMRGRVSALHMLFVGTSNELGQFRAGTFAGWLGTVPAVVLGGVGTLAVVALWSWLFPELRKLDRVADLQD
ncbi:MAG TPA: MFS transporter [Alphaproteobacteria bacterium]|nr:MFS transporter [Alphaproteobacteria bacterium]